MLNSNGNIKTLRYLKSYDADGLEADNQVCSWTVIERIKCVKLTNIEDKLLYKKEFEQNEELIAFRFHSKDQEKDRFDILKTDYILFILNNDIEDYQLYKIISRPTPRKLLCGCSYKMIGQRIEPRDSGVKDWICKNKIYSF